MTVKEIEREIQKMPRARLMKFRAWFSRFDSDAWDRQIEKDARAGKLAGMVSEAVTAYKAGKSREI
jgi:hypothetical protein